MLLVTPMTHEKQVRPVRRIAPVTRVMRSPPLLLLLLAPALVRAQVEPVSVTMVTHVPAGKKPTVTVKALARVTQVVLDLTCDETGAKVTARVPSLNAGQSKVFPIGDGAIGGAHYSGTLSLVWGAGEAWSGGVSVDTVVNAEIKIGYQREHLFLDRHLLEFQISRPSKQLEAELTVYGDQGQVIGQAQQSYASAAAGKWLAISWEPTDESR